VPWHFPLHAEPSITGASHKAEQQFKETYPAIYAHLSEYKSELLQRNKAETGIRYEWYALQRWGANYWEDFFKPKIMYSEIVQEPQFYFDQEGYFFPEATVFIMTGEKLEFLYHALHTKIATFIFKTFYAGGGLGEHGYRYKKKFLENLPIPKPNEKFDYENIEQSIADLYGLTNVEIEFIETKMKK
jgi:hypothetical protein